jgi:4-hydroxyacetophenone monooxygenase
MPNGADQNSALPAALFQPAAADEAVLRAALRDADIVPQLLVHAQLTGETRLLDEARPYIQGGWSYQQVVPNELAARIQDALVRALKDAASGASRPGSRPSVEQFRYLMSAGIGTDLPPHYAEMWLEEWNGEGQDLRSVAWRSEPDSAERKRFMVVIVGAGLAGLCMGIKLREAGIPFVILEKNTEVGGTWYENSYPGAGVDIPNHFYSFSFAPKHDWSRHFAKRDELWAYLDELTDRFDIREHIRFGTEVVSAEFDEARSAWTVTTREPDGGTATVTGNVFVPAVGQLNRPKIPNIPGLDTFKGPAFHTARWDHGQDLAGRTVALVGTGASSMQVGPSIAGEVEKLLVFQRSPSWAALNPNYQREVSEGMQWALAHIPFFARWYRYLLFWASGDVLHTSLQVDPSWPHPERSLNAENDAMRERLTAYIRQELEGRPDLLAKSLPTYPPYGKRMLRDNGWYRMLRRPNVELIDAEVTRVTSDAIVDGEGRTHQVDVIVLATGFQASRMLWPMKVTGRAGRTLHEVWGEDDPRAYLGITVPGFPNMFVLYGPNTNLAHGGSLFFHAECQVRYVMQAVRELLEGGSAAIECRTEPFERYNAQLDEAHRSMVWNHGGMRNWYKNSRGRVVANSPWRLVDYWRLTLELDPADFLFTPRQADGKALPRVGLAPASSAA